MIYKYFYWSHPNRSGGYERRLEEEKINLRDERKESLRNKSGRYAYLLGLFIVSMLIVAVSILDVYAVTLSNGMVIIVLFTFLMFEFIIGIVIFRYLDKRY